MPLKIVSEAFEFSKDLSRFKYVCVQDITIYTANILCYFSHRNKITWCWQLNDASDSGIIEMSKHVFDCQKLNGETNFRRMIMHILYNTDSIANTMLYETDDIKYIVGLYRCDYTREQLESSTDNCVLLHVDYRIVFTDVYLSQAYEIAHDIKI